MGRDHERPDRLPSAAASVQNIEGVLRYRDMAVPALHPGVGTDISFLTGDLAACHASDTNGRSSTGGGPAVYETSKVVLWRVMAACADSGSFSACCDVIPTATGFVVKTVVSSMSFAT
jgi:hypothetical protein